MIAEECDRVPNDCFSGFGLFRPRYKTLISVAHLDPLAFH